MIPAVLDDTITAVPADIERWGATRPADDELVARRRTGVDAIAAKYRVTPPQEVRDQVRTPWPSENVFGLIAQKTWRLVLSRRSLFWPTGRERRFPPWCSQRSPGWFAR